MAKQATKIKSGKRSALDKLPVEYRDHIKRVCNELRIIYFVGEYEMDICWCGKQETRDESEVIAKIESDARYLCFTLHISPKVFKYWNEGDDDRIFRVLAHEFAHLIIDPLYHPVYKELSPAAQEHLNDIRERQTQRVANVVCHFVPEKVWKRRKK